VKNKIRNPDPLAIFSLGLGLGALSAQAFPEGELGNFEQEFGDKFTSIGDELRSAANESAKVLKDIFIQDVKDFDLKIFR
jgi:hypothetical protein